MFPFSKQHPSIHADCQAVEIIASSSEPGRAKRFSVVAYTGKPMDIRGYELPVVVDLAGLTFRNQVQANLDHDSTQRVGQVDSIDNDGRRLVLSGLLNAATPFRDEVIASSKDGYKWAASIEAKPTKIETIKANQKATVNGQSIEGPVYVTRKAVLSGFAFVAEGADDDTSAKLEAKFQNHNQKESENIMDQKFVSFVESVGFNVADLTAQQLIGFKATYEGKPSTPNTIEAQQQRENAIEKLYASAPQPYTPDHRPFQGSSRATLEAGLLLRVGKDDLAVNCYGEQVVEAASKSRIGSLVDLAKATLQAEHRDVPAGNDAVIKAAFSTTVLPTILSNVVGRALIESFQQTTSNWRSFVSIKSAANFKTQTGVRPSSFENLKKLPATGEINHVVAAEDGAYTWAISTFARMISVTRTDMVNDDLKAFDQYPNLLGQAAGRSLNDLLWTTIMGGEVSGYFAAGNNNLVTSSALALEKLGAAVAKMRKQVDANGNNIDVMPQALVVPPDLEATARSLLYSQEIHGSAGSTPSGNPMQGIVNDLVVESRLSNASFTGNSAAHWYLFASPVSHSVIVGFLNGAQFPTVEVEQSDFNKLGVQMRVFHDYGVALADPRGALKAK